MWTAREFFLSWKIKGPHFFFNYFTFRGFQRYFQGSQRYFQGMQDREPGFFFLSFRTSGRFNKFFGVREKICQVTGNMELLWRFKLIWGKLGSFLVTSQKGQNL